MTEQNNQDNIVVFPNQRTTPQSIEEVIEATNNIKVLHIQETIQTIIPIIMDMLYAGGFNFKFDETNKCIKETALIAETIKSLLMKFYDMEHPLQEVANNTFEEVGQGIVHYKTTNESFDALGEETETI